MNYEEFIEYIRTHLSSYFEPETTILIHRVLKNNSTELDGISVLKKNQTISPTLYLNDYYEEYRTGTSVEDLLEELYHNFLHPYTDFPFSVTDFKKFDLMKGKIVYRLINYSQNETLLSDIPHKKYLDLAMVYYLLLHSDETGNACILIRKEHLLLWSTTADSIERHARSNTPILLPAKLQHMEELLRSCLSCDTGAEETPIFESYEKDFQKLPMYVLTNQIHFNGAASLLYPNVLQEFAHTMGTNFYILPSSIHETILVPANGITSKANLEQMVKEINEQEVSPTERLSDCVYYYDRFTQTISM